MALGRLLVAWIVVMVGLLLWDVVGSRIGGTRRNGRLARTLAAGGRLAWRLGPT